MSSRFLTTTTAIGLLVLWSIVPTASGSTIFLDADTPATGSNLESSPLVTPFGTITFSGEVTSTADPDTIAAGSVGNVFDIDNGSETAELRFGFDVQSIEFIYGGNSGVFDIEARDIGGNVVDSFFQASTDSGEPAGPVTLTASVAPIRSLFWEDPGFSFSNIDNVTINAAVIPEPASLALCGMGLIAASGVALRRARRSAKV